MGRGVYICEQGYHGNICFIFGFTMCDKENDGQGVFHMTSVIQGKDSYQLLKRTIANPLEEDRDYLLNSCIGQLFITTEDGIVHTSILYLPKQFNIDTIQPLSKYINVNQEN